MEVVIVRADDLAQGIRCLLCKPEDWIQILRTHTKRGNGCIDSLVTLVLIQWRQGIPQGRLATRPAKSVSSELRERPCLNKYCGVQRMPSSILCTYRPVNTHVHMPHAYAPPKSSLSYLKSRVVTGYQRLCSSPEASSPLPLKPLQDKLWGLHL